MWDFKREENQFKPIPEGKYRVRIKEADKAVSKNGNDMLVLQLEVSGQKSILYHYIVFLVDKPEITNRMLTQFFDSFKDIPEGDFNMSQWVGKVGACTVKHDDEGRAKVGYFINVNKQAELPAWKEPYGEDGGGTPAVEIQEDEIPF